METRGPQSIIKGPQLLSHAEGPTLALITKANKKPLHAYVMKLHRVTYLCGAHIYIDDIC